MNFKILVNTTKPLLGIVVVATLFLASKYVVADEQMIGAEEFRTSCASCHGTDGKGHGPLASILMTKPADLTVIAKNNAGHYPNTKAGEYPFYKVFQIIDGRTQVSGHGDRTMPVWGSRYSMEEGLKYGPMGGEQVIRGRILELVYYIQSIQER